MRSHTSSLGDGAGRRNEAHGLAVAAVQRDGDAHALAVLAAGLEAVRAPAGVADIGRDTAFVQALRSTKGMSREQEPVHLHHPIDTLHVRRGVAILLSLATQQGMDATIAAGWQSAMSVRIVATSSSSGAGGRSSCRRGTALRRDERFGARELQG